MESIQGAANTLGLSIISELHSTIGTRTDTLAYDMNTGKQQLLNTLQLIYSDLLAEVTQNPAHKLFYLKSKIDQLNNGQTLSTEQFNYLSILQSELNKLNQDNKLLG